MLPNQPTKPIKRAGSKRRRSSTLKGLVDGKIPVLGNRNEVNSTFIITAKVIIEKFRGDVFLIEQDTIENVSCRIKKDFFVYF